MTQEPYLGVEASASGRFWQGLDVETERQADLIAQQTGLDFAISKILARLTVPASEAALYLAPSLKELMPDPRTMRDMDVASARLAQAAQTGERVAIFADYDVDGACSAALLVDWCRAFGIEPTTYVPDRIDEGYGPNVPAMQELAQKHSLIICVDCGTLSFEPVAAVTGTDVLILDHHLGGETLPEALAVVNPNRQDETGALAYLCAAGVVFMTLVAANRVLREQQAKTPDLMPLLDLVALATVADVAPLIGLNRAFVRQGLKVMAGRGRHALAALADAAGLNTTPSAYHLGYLLGPRINAGGRVGKADLGVRLLSAKEPELARALADRLDQLNEERREIELQVQLQAIEQAEARGFDAPLVWAAGADWHPGVVGIVASRLKEAANRPAIVIGLADGVGKGSGRSISGIDLGAAVAKITREGLLQAGGGHKMAAGLTVAEDQLEAAMARLSELLEKQGANRVGPKTLRIDAALSARAATPELIAQMEQAGPYGAGASAPRFAFANMRVAFAKRAGDSHLRLTFQDDEGARVDAIFFRAFETAMGEMLEKHGGRAFHVAGRLELDTWGGRMKAKLKVEDIAPAS